MRKVDRQTDAGEAAADDGHREVQPHEGAPRLLHERIAAGRAAVIARLALALVPGSGLPDPELSAHMLSAYADEAARLVLQDYDVERILELTRWVLARLGAYDSRS